MRVFYVLIGFLAALIAPARSEDFPTRAISVVTSIAPGAPSDLVGRIFVERLRARLGVPLPIENVTGGRGLVATLKVLQSKADGYTALLSAAGLTTAPVTMKNAGYAASDFVPVAVLGQVPYVLLVGENVPARDIPSLLAYLRANGPAVNSGVLTISNVSTLLSRKLAAAAGTEFTEVGYRGSGEMIAALLRGDIQFMATTYSVAAPHLATGKVRAIGALAPERIRQMPDLQTFAEHGFPSLNVNIWTALFVRSSTPKDIIEKYRTASALVLSEQSYPAAIDATGTDPWPISIADFAKYIDAEAKAFADDAVRFKLTIE